MYSTVSTVSVATEESAPMFKLLIVFIAAAFFVYSFALAFQGKLEMKQFIHDYYLVKSKAKTIDF